jgi:putative membrane protein
MRFLIHWATVAVSLWVATELVPGIRVRSFTALVIAALVLGLINACVRPLLVVLTFPITILTLGLFYLVVNGLAFGLAAWLVPGFSVHGLIPAMLGALIVSVLSWFIGLFTGRDDDKKKRKKRERD